MTPESHNPRPSDIHESGDEFHPTTDRIVHAGGKRGGPTTEVRHVQTVEFLPLTARLETPTTSRHRLPEHIDTTLTHRRRSMAALLQSTRGRMILLLLTLALIAMVMFELYAYKVGMGIDILPQQHSSEIPELLIQEVTE